MHMKRNMSRVENKHGNNERGKRKKKKPGKYTENMNYIHLLSTWASVLSTCRVSFRS